jgi:LPS export ABC transporter protein LptC
MSQWQRRARLLIAIVAVAFAIVVAFAFRKRVPAGAFAPAATADPKAVVESAKGWHTRVNGEQEQVLTEYETFSSYPDGSTKMIGVKVTTRRAGDRTFVITGNQAEVGQNEANISLAGNVHITVSDGMDIRTERATYSESDGMVRAPGPVQFSRARLSGSGLGLTYAKNLDLLTILDKAVVHVAPDSSGAGGVAISAGVAEFNRPDKAIRFTGATTVSRAAQIIDADSGVAHLSANEERLEALELRGNARIAASDGAVGGLKAMTGRAIDLKYAPDGQTLQHALVTGDATIQVNGERGQSGRQITANALDLVLASDGSTPTLLTARDNVQLTIPAERGEPARTIRAQTLDGEGEAGRGLTRARFAGGVQFRERGGDVDRSAQSGTLDTTLAPGLSQIEEARFAQAVRFESAGLSAAAALARYVLGKGLLELSGTEPVLATPHVVTDRISVYGTRIDVALSGPMVKAAGAIKSELKPPKKDAGQPQSGQAADARMPSIFKQDQIVTATAGDLAYDGTASRAIYTGSAQLWQGETSIKAASITLEERSGDLTASGPVVTTIGLEQERKDKQKERIHTTGSAKDFQYEESLRRATYVGGAHLNGPQGDMTAEKIELYLKESGDELERAEGYEAVTLRDQNRETRGTRMTYFAADERYVVAGTPVTIKDECGRETTGKTATFNKTADTVAVDGNEQTRTATRGSANCP